MYSLMNSESKTKSKTKHPSIAKYKEHAVSGSYDFELLKSMVKSRSPVFTVQLVNISRVHRYCRARKSTASIISI